MFKLCGMVERLLAAVMGCVCNRDPSDSGGVEISVRSPHGEAISPEYQRSEGEKLDGMAGRLLVTIMSNNYYVDNQTAVCRDEQNKP